MLDDQIDFDMDERAGGQGSSPAQPNNEPKSKKITSLANYCDTDLLTMSPEAIESLPAKLKLEFIDRTHPKDLSDAQLVALYNPYSPKQNIGYSCTLAVMSPFPLSSKQNKTAVMRFTRTVFNKTISYVQMNPHGTVPSGIPARLLWIYLCSEVVFKMRHWEEHKLNKLMSEEELKYNDLPDLGKAKKHKADAEKSLNQCLELDLGVTIKQLTKHLGLSRYSEEAVKTQLINLLTTSIFFSSEDKGQDTPAKINADLKQESQKIQIIPIADTISATEVINKLNEKSYIGSIRLSPQFAELLFDRTEKNQEAALPLNLDTIAKIVAHKNVLALDLYCWLHYRSHSPKVNRIPIASLLSQFGTELDVKKKPADFLKRLYVALEIVKEEWPALKSDVKGIGRDAMLWLYPSKSDVEANPKVKAYEEA